MPFRLLWNLDGLQFCYTVDEVYQEVVYQKKNSLVSRGSLDKACVCELARLFVAMGEGSTLETVVLKVIVAASILLLQKLSCTSKGGNHILLLEETMKLWREGNLIAAKGRTIQSHLRDHLPKPNETQIVSKLMFEDKTKDALQLATGWWSPKPVREKSLILPVIVVLRTSCLLLLC